MSEEAKNIEAAEIAMNTVAEAKTATEAVADEAIETETKTTAESTPTPEEVNAANAERSTGKVDDDGMGAAFFTAADVRAMSREQVRRNLPKILKSMESDKF